MEIRFVALLTSFLSPVILLNVSLVGVCCDWFRFLWHASVSITKLVKCKQEKSQEIFTVLFQQLILCGCSVVDRLVVRDGVVPDGHVWGGWCTVPHSSHNVYRHEIVRTSRTEVLQLQLFIFPSQNVENQISGGVTWSAERILTISMGWKQVLHQGRVLAAMLYVSLSVNYAERGNVM